MLAGCVSASWGGKCTWVRILWNLRIVDVLGPLIISFIRRFHCIHVQGKTLVVLAVDCFFSPALDFAIKFLMDSELLLLVPF